MRRKGQTKLRLEMCVGIGIAIGAPIGWWLYSHGETAWTLAPMIVGAVLGILWHDLSIGGYDWGTFAKWVIGVLLGFIGLGIDLSDTSTSSGTSTSEVARFLPEILLFIIYLPFGLLGAFMIQAYSSTWHLLWSFVLIVFPLGSFSLSYWLHFKKKRYWLALLVMLPAIASTLSTILLCLPCV